MSLLKRVNTIRAKVIIGILFLILIVQMGSSGFLYQQTRTILMEEFVLGSQNLVEPLFTILKEQIKNVSPDDVEFKRENIDGIMDAYVKMLGYQHFESILGAKKDLIAIRYIDFNDKILIDSGHMEEEGEQKTIDSLVPQVVNMFKNQKLDSFDHNDQLDVFVPFTYRDNFLGGFILEHSQERINAVKDKILKVSLALIVIYTLISLTLVIILFNKVLIKPINKMIRVVQKVAKGDLEDQIEISSNDEISEIAKAVNDLIANLKLAFGHINRVMSEVEKGNLSSTIDIDLEGEFEHLKHSINRSVAMLGETVTYVATTSEQVDIGSSELSRVSSELSSNTNQMASTLEQISSSMLEIEKKTRDNTQNSMKAQQLSATALEMVQKGNQQMDAMLVSIHSISNTSNDVSKIIKAIDEIAFQTNLLALNAAVEAARAGKYGKGFAVVADEVRNLAARSTEAARNTTSLIESSLKVVKEGVENAEKTSEILTKVTDSVTQSNQLMNEVVEASQQQTQGITEINLGINQINEIVQRNSAVSEETASSAVELSGQSSDLRDVVGRFKVRGLIEQV